jgi:hypothetical protein
MRPYYPYEDHKTLESARFRHRERDLAHRRARKGDEPSDGIMTRMLSAFKRLPPAELHAPVRILDEFVLTDSVCRLADGTTGRIAVRESEGELIEVCVRA